MMDPNSSTPAPEPTPEQPSTTTPTTPTPEPVTPEQPSTPTPQPAPVVAPQVTPPQPQVAPNGKPPKKKNKALIFGIIGGVLFLVLVIVGAVVAGNALSRIDESANANNQSEAQQEDTAEEETTPEVNNTNITAKSLLEMRAVCVGGSIANAAPYQKPYVMVMYQNNDVLPGVFKKDPTDRQLWGTYGYTSLEGAVDNPETPYIDESAPKYTQVNSVVCLDRDDATAVKATTCQIKTTDGDTVALDYYSVKYKMTLYEAKTGKKVQEFEPVNGTASDATCTDADDWEADDPKFYANPSLDEINNRLAPYE